MSHTEYVRTYLYYEHPDPTGMDASTRHSGTSSPFRTKSRFHPDRPLAFLDAGSCMAAGTPAPLKRQITVLSVHSWCLRALRRQYELIRSERDPAAQSSFSPSNTNSSNDEFPQFRTNATAQQLGSLRNSPRNQLATGCRSILIPAQLQGENLQGKVRCKGVQFQDLSYDRGIICLQAEET